MPTRVLASFPLPDAALGRLSEYADVKLFPDLEGASLGAALAETEGLLISSRNRIDRHLLNCAPKLRVISTYSVGLDHIDLDAARERGIAVGHTPVLTDAVADLVLTLILMLARRMPEALRIGATSTWQPIPMGLDLRGKNLFIIGFGRIGQEVARRAAAFKMEVSWFDPRPPRTPFEGATQVSELSKGLAVADFVTVNADLNPGTRHLIGRGVLASMKPAAYIVNASRGAVVDQTALTEALRAKRIAGAALDVLEEEPPSADEPLLSMPNVIVVPHIGSATVETRQAMLDCALDNLIGGLTGEGGPFLVIS